MTANSVQQALRDIADPKRAEQTQTFFKTGPGEYSEGDRFLGIRVPHQRSIAKQYRDLALPEVGKLLRSGYHEDRFTALLILELQFKKAPGMNRQPIIDLYFENLSRINNWDLVDLSAPSIVGPWFEDRSREPLYELADSDDLWERRISIVSTFHFIRQGELEPTLMLSDRLMNDSHDLIHKAVGWMLREVGKQETDVLTGYLNKRYDKMPRTMLRYAIERFPEELRQDYLKGRV